MIDIEYENLSELIGILREKKIFLYEEDGKLKYRQNDFKLTKDILEILLENKNEIINILKLEKESKNLLKICNVSEFSLTEIQSAYLFGKGDMYKYGDVSCHMCMELIYPQLDRNRVEEIWNFLIKRHEMLKVVFKSSGSQYIIENPPDFKLFNKDDNNKDDIVDLLYSKKYPSDKWPLFDIACFNNGNKSELLLSFDMMIADWRSIWILINEFETIYFNKGKLQNNKYTFRDYIETETYRKKFPGYYADKYYWISKMEELLTSPKIKIIEDTNCKNKGKFNRYSYFLSKEMWEGIKSIERTIGVTSSCTLMAIYAYTLAKYSENKKFALNCTIMERDRYGDDFKNIVGDFTNILLLGVNFESEITFSNQVKDLQFKLISDIEHSRFSGVDVLREIRKQQATRNNLYPYVFTSSIGFNTNNNDIIGQYTGKGISQTPQVFIDCQVVDFEENLYINWDVREGIFEDTFIEEMFNSFINMLMELEKVENWEKIISIKSLNFNDRLLNKTFVEDVQVSNNIETSVHFDYENELYLKIKEVLINVWTNLLSKDINENSDIFIEGADSLLIAQASSKVSKEFSKLNIGVNMPFDSLMRIMIEKPQIERIALDIFLKFSNENERSVQKNNNNLGKIKFIRKTQEKDLIVIIHSGLGHVNKINNFITSLFSCTKQDIAAIEINNMKDFIKISTENLFEIVGGEYFNLIKDYEYTNIQIIGHCIGGMIACEVARELVKNNFNVIDISLIDSIPATNQYNEEIITELLFIKMLGINFIDVSIIDFTENDLNKYLNFVIESNTTKDRKVEESMIKIKKISKKDRFREYFHDDIEEDEELILLYEVFKKNSEAASYKISPLISDIRLFIANGSDEVIPKDINEIAKFWEEVCIGNFSTTQINGNHNSCIEDKKNSECLAEKVSEKWDKY